MITEKNAADKGSTGAERGESFIFKARKLWYNIWAHNEVYNALIAQF